MQKKRLTTTTAASEESKSGTESTPAKEDPEHRSLRKKIDPEAPPTVAEPAPAKSSFLDRIKPDTPLASFEPIFDSLAETLINRYELVVCNKAFRLREIEFYVNHPNHPDPYAHKDGDLRILGGWYFHKKGKSYTGGSRKGHDITFGSPGHVGGILIRSFEVGPGKIIDGCSLCVDYLLTECHKKYPEITSVSTLVKHPTFTNDVLDPAAIMHIRKLPETAPELKYYKGPRVGLSDNCPEYRDKLYRYLVLPAKVKKGKPGMIWALLKSGLGRAEVQKLTGALLGTVDKIASAIAKGK